MLVLFETASGFAVYKVLKEKKLQQPDNLYKEFKSAEKASKFLKLKHFEKFSDIQDSIDSATAIIKGKMSKKLKKFLKKIFVEEAQEELAVADAKLGNTISSKLNISCVSNSAIQELMRCIRMHLDSLLDGLPQKELAAMSLGVAHSLSRYKFKFSPDKIDKMIIEAVNTLDDLDKELNNYTMRCKEWYGWHFPELSKIISDNQLYIKTILAIGFRENAINTDLSDLLTEEDEQKVKEMAEISMGTEILEEDLTNIKNLCEEVLQMQDCRARLSEYLKNRMAAIAPNMASLVGEMVGARLIAHAGSLVNLAKHPASTVQILGAEKALFRALKARHDTPKYGLIYHAQLIGQSHTALKGKMSRMLAAKTALAARVDAFGEEDIDIGVEHRAKLERALKQLEEGKTTRLSGTGKAKARFDRYENKSKVFQYKASDDSFLTTKLDKKKRKLDDTAEETVPVKKVKLEIKKEDDSE
ncbi:nucleolar protein 58-like [Stegodyphus dumicola]|uniref:nucleolar protein 58-like n=1 Tax=Stegodyphus dumicola TaxID=202533 RepID=UPI0015AE491E|nr:nucleolar protein 58-like [Stegodyphus dumicola]